MRTLLVATTAVVLGLAAGPAHGQTEGVPDGGAYEVAPLSATETAAAAKCKTVHAWAGWKNLFGVYYWKYFEQISWCWGGGKVTAASRKRWAQCCLQLSGWEFKGHIGSDINGGVGKGYYSAWTQGKFQQCYAYCFNTKTPCVRVRGNADGSWSAWWNANC